MSFAYITLLRTGLVILLGTVLVACATSVGKNFEIPHPKTLELSTTNYQQIIQRFGEPFTKGQSSLNGKIVESINYTYSESVRSFENVVPTRSMTFEFFDNLLVAYTFVSSFPRDSTDFDESKVSAITKDQSTVDQVIALIGEPSGKMSWPVVRDNEERAIKYFYVQARQSPSKMTIFHKALTVTHNKRGLVTNVEFVTQGDK